MATYTSDATDLPVSFTLSPVFNLAGAVTAANITGQFQSRIVNNADPTDIFFKNTKTVSFDMIGAKGSSTVNVAGIGNITYIQIASAIRKMLDAERLLLS